MQINIKKNWSRCIKGNESLVYAYARETKQFYIITIRPLTHRLKERHICPAKPSNWWVIRRTMLIWHLVNFYYFPTSKTNYVINDFRDLKPTSNTNFFFNDFRDLKKHLKHSKLITHFFHYYYVKHL